MNMTRTRALEASSGYMSHIYDSSLLPIMFYVTSLHIKLAIEPPFKVDTVMSLCVVIHDSQSDDLIKCFMKVAWINAKSLLSQSGYLIIFYSCIHCRVT